MMEARAETEDKGDAEPIFFPPEVVIEILCRLPIRPRAKLQLVSKEWRGFICGRYLMEKNVDRREINCSWRNLVAPDADQSFSLLDACDGLLLIKIPHTMTKLAIWNPATRGILRLPDPCKDAFEVTLNYVKSSGNYLVVSMYKDESGIEGCEVLTPGQSESWRPLAFPYVAEAEGRIDKVVVKVVSTGEAVHTVLILQLGSTLVRKLVSLDLETECFTVTCFAKTEFQELTTLWPVNWNGKLALTKFVGNNLHVTEMEDYKKQR